MGAPLHKWQKFINKHRIVVFSSNYALYGDMSRRVMNLLSRYSPTQEIYSVDESFLDFTGMDNPTAHARNLRENIRMRTGIPVAVGIAPTKTLAKLANHCAKKLSPWQTVGVCNFGELSMPERSRLSAHLPVGEVWGISSRLSDQLQQLSINSVEQLRTASPKRVRDRFGIAVERIVAELNGEPCIELSATASDKQQIISSRSFAGLVTELEELQAAIATHVSRAAEKLRQQQCVAATISLYIRTNPFREQDRQLTQSVRVALPLPTDDTLAMQEQASIALRQLYRKGYNYKKVGVGLTEIIRKANRQTDFFETATTAKRESLSAVLDKINHVYGKHTIRCAAELMGHNWHMRQEKRSPHYTTDWDEILLVG